ncbi:glycosyltransferase [Bacillus daqingensis]|uniref:Glycosyltransferase n=1 Tax=Bacillus daqingensis TaxID=872396 RepID=A0ABV9NV42_9BACI
MKHRLLVVIETLECAGAEKSLISFLSNLDFDYYSVDLQLFRHGGALQQYVPKQVNILSEFDYIKACKKSFSWRPDYAASRMIYSLLIRKRGGSNKRNARYHWLTSKNRFPVSENVYDTAVAYSHGLPTFYVAEKVVANKKIAWVNAIFNVDESEQLFLQPIYKKFDQVVGVSEEVKKSFLQNQLFQCINVNVFQDIVDVEMVRKLAQASAAFQRHEDLQLITLGRLAKHKGFDRLLQTAAILKDRGVRFHWLVLGDGPLRNELVHQLTQLKLHNLVEFAGVKVNPYPYLIQSDIYVQTSDVEGYGLAIAEARTLGVPLVTTPFSAVGQQIIHQKNGIVSTFEPEQLAEDILFLYKNQSLYKKISAYQRAELIGKSKRYSDTKKILLAPTETEESSHEKKNPLCVN